MRLCAIYDTMALERDFEKFRGGANEALQDRVYVTLSPTRNIVLNRNAYERLGRPGSVRLYYSRLRDCIGIENSSGNFNDSFPVRTNGPVGWRISAAPFCRHFNISVETTVKFLTPEFIGPSLLLNLGDIISVARPKRRRKT